MHRRTAAVVSAHLAEARFLQREQSRAPNASPMPHPQSWEFVISPAVQLPWSVHPVMFPSCVVGLPMPGDEVYASWQSARGGGSEAKSLGHMVAVRGEKMPGSSA